MELTRTNLSFTTYSNASKSGTAPSRKQKSTWKTRSLLLSTKIKLKIWAKSTTSLSSLTSTHLEARPFTKLRRSARLFQALFTKSLAQVKSLPSKFQSRSTTRKMSPFLTSFIRRSSCNSSKTTALTAWSSSSQACTRKYLSSIRTPRRSSTTSHSSISLKSLSSICSTAQLLALSKRKTSTKKAIAHRKSTLKRSTSISTTKACSS